jgi:hypothetical protein
VLDFAEEHTGTDPYNRGRGNAPVWGNKVAR